MDIEKIIYLLKKIPKKYYFPIILASFGMTFFIYGLIQLLGQNASVKNSVVLGDQSTTPSANLGTNAPKFQSLHIVIDVEGAVLHPGLYTLSKDSRIEDGLIAAGGLSADADRNFVSKKVNLASKLLDGAKIYIPKMGDSNSVATSQDVAGASTDVSAILNINTASAGDLDALPGVGQVTAQKIIDGRPYNDINQLISRKIIGKSIFDKIKDRVSTE